MPTAQELLPWVQIGTGITTAALAAMAYLISREQARYSREKLRLDLYNRRFAIYDLALTFYRALVVYDGKRSPEFESMSIDFAHGVKESQFLFDDSAGVPTRLVSMMAAFGRIAGFKEEGSKLASHPPTFIELNAKVQDDLDRLPFQIGALEETLAPYLDFHKIVA